MMSVLDQIGSGRLVCPVTYGKLVVREDRIETEDGSRRYPFVNGVPVLFSDLDRQRIYLDQVGGGMNQEYSEGKSGTLKTWLRSVVDHDYRPVAHWAAFHDVVAPTHPPTSGSSFLCLSIGGGPRREHENICNLNIGLFPDVDVVADAYELPYANESIDAIYCEAVLEHLEFPDTAVREMWRVLKKGGKVFAATPFLQWYHAYPNHFQNFTLTGHEQLFRRAGFHLIASGTSVGPTVALSMLITSYLKAFLPWALLRKAVGWAVAMIFVPIRTLDLLINKHPESHRLASATFVHLIKPTT